jgi:hypothetical protein
MKRYILKTSKFTPENRGWTSQGYVERKAFDILTGLALGILADGELTAKEANFLAQWIAANSHSLPENFIRNLLPVIGIAGRGEDVSEDDLDMITQLLESIVFCDVPSDSTNSPGLIGTPCALVFDEVDLSEIGIPGREFVLTGNFSSGSKNDLMARANRLGAFAKSATPTKQTDYVVVGSKGSEHWAYSGLGRKVEHALKLKSESCKLRIIREEDFIQALESIDQTGNDR